MKLWKSLGAVLVVANIVLGFVNLLAGSYWTALLSFGAALFVLFTL